MGRSPAYIVLFATAVCLVCAVFVAGSAVALKDKQEVNKVIDRQTKVLNVAGLLREDQDATKAEVTALFEKSVKAKVVDLKTGEYVDDVDASAFDQQKAKSDPATSHSIPTNLAGVPRIPNRALVYHVMKNDSLVMYVLPVEGKGLWSTLYGYLALAPDTNTIRGLTFYQHGETPGLGGEVDNPGWKALWPGRKAYGEDWEPKITVKKGQAGSPEEDPYHVDGLSGATITSRGVGHLLQLWLGSEGFGPYLAKMRGEGKA